MGVMSEIQAELKNAHKEKSPVNAITEDNSLPSAQASECQSGLQRTGDAYIIQQTNRLLA